MGLLSTIGSASGRAFGFTRSAIAAATDAFFNRVTLLLPGNGTNGAQNNTFLDSSTNNFTITRNGNTTQGTFSPFSQSGWSCYLNGSSYVAPPGGSLTNITGGQLNTTQVFTVEAFLNIPGNMLVAGDVTPTGGSNAWAMSIDTNGYPTFGWWNGSAYTTRTGTVAMSFNTWTHVAWVINAGTVYFYVNGVAAGSNTFTNGVETWGLAIGGYNNTFRPGYISNLRITKSAVYSSAFTVPTTQLSAITNTSLLIFQDNRFKDNSTNNYTLTLGGTPAIQPFSPFAPTAAYSAATNGGSGYFDGTGDSVSAANNAAFDVTKGDFTLETWVYRNVSGAGHYMFSHRTDAPVAGYEFRINSTNLFQFFYTGGSSITSSASVPALAWTHLAVTRSGTTVRLFINGVLDSSATFSNGSTASTTLIIGTANDGTGGMNGYMSGARIVKGTAVYTATFTPPTAPPTAITNTSFLLNFTNAGITDATAKNVLETVGNAQISTTQSKWGGSSLYFDGTGDRLYFADGKAYVNGTEPFTLECWVYLGGTPNYWTIFGSSSGSGLLFTVQNLTTVIVNPSGAGNTLSGTTSLTAGTWFHLALTRNSSNRFDIWVNGVSVGNATSSQSFGTPTHFVIGAADNSGGQQFNGYLDDVRISKFCRYTTTFTPPTAAFALQ